MINAKELYNQIFSDERITALVPDENIFPSYPDEVEIFPCIAFMDDNQSDTEYNENMPGGENLSVMVHIFSKKLEEYLTTAKIAEVVAQVFNEKLWNCSQNREIADPDPNTEHRVMVFNTSIFNN